MCIYQIAEEKWEYSGEIYHLYTDFKKVYDLVEEIGFFIMLSMNVVFI